MSEVEAGLSRGGMGLKGLVEGEAGVEHRGHRGQAPLASGGGPRPAFLSPPTVVPHEQPVSLSLRSFQVPRRQRVRWGGSPWAEWKPVSAQTLL